MERPNTPRTPTLRNWRRLLSDLLIIAGLAMVLYPVGTWAFAWWQQRDLQRELSASSAVFRTDARELFDVGLVFASAETTALAAQDRAAVQGEQRDLRRATAQAEREARLQDFRRAAADFEKTLATKGGVAIGKILIPSLGIDRVLVQGTGRSDLREGPGHWPETPLPGQHGNFIISGHRTTYGAPFYKLDRLRKGDLIEVVLPYAAVRYRVTKTMIVRPDQVDVVAQRGLEQISLATCHPIYSASQRLVVQGDLEAFKLLPETAPAAGASPPPG